jgi:Ca2+-binding EF-hand superfamily protein
MRPDTSQTNKTLQLAAVQTLTTPRANLEEYSEAVYSARAPVSRCTAHSDAKKFVESLASKSRTNNRQPKTNYSSLGEYRPHMRPADEVMAEDKEAQKAEKGELAVEFQNIMKIVGEKIRQKFSKARDVFRFVDCDHNSKISRSECQYFFRFFNVPETQADKFFDGFEKDEDGEICYVEFLKHLWPHINPGNEAQPWRLSVESKEQGKPSMGSANGSGFQLGKTKTYFSTNSEAALASLELPAPLRSARMNISQRLSLRYKHWRDAYRDLDTDHDGVVTLEEMRIFFRNFGWEHVAEKFYQVLSKDETVDITFSTFTALFDVSKDQQALRLRLA